MPGRAAHATCRSPCVGDDPFPDGSPVSHCRRGLRAQVWSAGWPATSEFLLVEQHLVVRAGHNVQEPVTLVEAPGVSVDLVGVDVHLSCVPLAAQLQRVLQQRRADASVAQVRAHVQLFELGQQPIEMTSASRTAVTLSRTTGSVIRPSLPTIWRVTGILTHASGTTAACT